MLEVLVYLLENYRCVEACPKETVLAQKLTSQGFSEYSVRCALFWLSELSESLGQEKSIAFQKKSIRIYTSQEKQKLDVECLQLLYMLESCELISPFVRELIIERALAIKEASLGLEKFKIIILIVLWGKNHSIHNAATSQFLATAKETTIQ